MATKAKAAPKPGQIGVEMDLANRTMTFTVCESSEGPIVFDLNRTHPDNQTRAQFHGWKQRISDAAALSRDEETGRAASPDEKWAEMRRLVDHYESGTADWSRAGGGGQQPGALTIEAIMRVKGWTVEQANQHVADFADKRYEGDTRKALAYLRTGERVAKAILEIQRERMGAPKVDADNALDELTGE